MNRTLSNMVFSLFMAMQADCAIKEPLKGNPACSYDPIEEPDEEKTERLGDVQCNELIPGHNNSFENRINVLFIGVNYSPEQFMEIVRNSVDCSQENSGILSHSILSDNIGQFNFWYTPEVQSLPFNNGRYHRGNGVVPNGLIGLGTEMASSCNTDKVQLQNVAPIVLAAENFRSDSTFPALIRHNLDNGNYSRLANARNNMARQNVDAQMCNDFAATCHILDANGDGRFTDEDRGLQISYSQQDLESMCLAAYNPGQCRQMGWNEIVEDYSNAKNEYGFELCQALAEASLESTINPSGELCDVMLANTPRLGTSEIFARNSIPKTVAHEFGHSVPALRDEYVEESRSNRLMHEQKLTENGINCFIGTYDECMANSNWSHLENTNCYEGCNYVSHGVYRPTENSIMRNTEHGEGYGPYGEERFCRVIKLLTGNAEGICKNYLNNEEIE